MQFTHVFLRRVVCGSPQMPVNTFSLSLLGASVSHPAAGTCGFLRRDAAAQSRSGRCRIPACILSATLQSAAAPQESACYAATHKHTQTHTVLTKQTGNEIRISL